MHSFFKTFAKIDFFMLQPSFLPSFFFNEIEKSMPEDSIIKNLNPRFYPFQASTSNFAIIWINYIYFGYQIVKPLPPSFFISYFCILIYYFIKKKLPWWKLKILTPVLIYFDLSFLWFVFRYIFCWWFFIVLCEGSKLKNESSHALEF